MTREEWEISKAIDRQRAFNETIQPILRAAVRHLSLYVPKIIIYPDGHSVHQYPPEYEQALAQYRGMIDLVASQFTREER